MKKIRRRAIMYNVSDGKTCKFHSAIHLPEGVKDPSTALYNLTISLFPQIDGRNLNITTHGNTLISCTVDHVNGVIVSIRSLISCICNDIELYENGNAYYRDTWIVKCGKAGTNDNFEYLVPIDNEGGIGRYHCFDTLADACNFIDTIN